jgi:type IV pilus assembly protein PilY1
MQTRSTHDDSLGQSDATVAQRSLRFIARVLLPVISLTVSLQPMALAAPSPSLLMQEPRFVDVSVESNVMFIMDDSLSMDDIRLPVPAGLNPGETTGGMVTVRGIATGLSGSAFAVGAAQSVSRNDDWIYRTAALNPLYYNPAIRYRAWNDNGRVGASGNFTAASTAINTTSNGFREGLVAHDMRYAGPNYTSSGFTSARRLTTTGANPPVVPAYLTATRPANGGFSGTVDSGRNQDIFSSPLVFVTNLETVCTAGSIGLQSTPLGTSPRAIAARPSTPITTSPRPNSTVLYEARPSVGVTYEARPTVPLSTEARNSTLVSYSTRPNSGAVTLSTRPNTPVGYEPRPYVARGETPRATQYRIETGACGTWGPWVTLGAPPVGLCSDPSAEGGVRAALVQTRLEPCSSGTQTATTCLADCGSGRTAGSVGATPVCYSNTCTTSTYVLDGSTSSATQCRSQCSGNIIGGQCYTSCVAPLQLNGAADTTTQCRTACSGNIIGGICYGSCVAPLVLDGSAGSATQCRTPCSGGNIIGGRCYTNCPTAGYSFVGSAGTATTCVAPCPGNVIGGVCYSNTCTTPGFVVGSPTSTQCQSTACTGGNIIGGRCYGACTTAGYVFDGSAGTATQCRSQCSGNIIGTQCYTACAAPLELDGAAGSATQCRTACSGTNNNVIAGSCYSACSPTTYSFLGSATTATQCVGPCSNPSFPNPHPSDPALCIASCPTGATTSGTSCIACPSGYTQYGSPAQCCPSANLQTVGVGCPVGQTCSTPFNYYPNLSLPALARYFVFQPATAIASPGPSDLQNPANYVLVEINRDRQISFPKGTQRTDCAGSTCTWAEEAQNFANWYAYYRTRLFSAIAVTAESLSGLTATAGLDRLRLGYGSINYFPNGANPYPNFDALSNPRLPTSMTIDGQSSLGAIVRGVRPFTEVDPPPSPGSNNRRQEVFDWLFSLRGIGSTPNREAIDAVGRYFARSDDRGPWIQPSNTSTWTSSEDPSDHIPCRRNYTIMITDGEWTNAPMIVDAPQQPVIGHSSRPALPTSLSAQGGSPLNALTTAGPQHTPFGSAALVAAPYQYTPAAEPQFSGGAGTVTETLTDAALYYWSRDLRPDLVNNIKPNSTGNKAFWQHLTPYIVGYGISASKDNATTRGAIAAGTSVTWPTVRLESRPTEDPRTIVTDRDGTQPGPSTPATQLTCNYDPITNPSGCGRVDDTFRAAMAARGDFLAATDVASLAASVASAFARIAEVEGSATAVGGRSGTLRAGDRLYFANFVTNRWTGKLDAYDALAWFNAASAGSAEPAPVAVSNFPAVSARNILTSTGVAGSGTTFLWANLTAAQQADLTSAAVLNYVRGDQSQESLNGGSFRNRESILGDIVNSSPLYSKAPDDRYNAARRPAADTNTGAGAANAYRQHVERNLANRPATIFVGSNGGMLHGFDATTLTERFAYVPRAVYSRLRFLTQPGYVHRYYVDGPVVEGDVFVGGAWKNVVVGTTGAGPKGVFALDVTQRTGSTPRNLETGDVLWDLTATDSVSNIGDLGHITQAGVIGSARDGNWYYFVGNGWESANDKAVLLAIRISDGAIVSIPTDNVGGPNPAAPTVNNQPNGLGGVTPVYDDKRNIVAIYAGDRLGRVWKFDLSSATPSVWASATGTTPLFVAADAANKRQPISAAPRIMAHPLGGRLIVVGTGRLTEADDPTDASKQAVYALWEKNVNSPAAIAKSNLRQFTMTETGTQAARNRTRSIIGTGDLNWGTDMGWYLELFPTNVTYASTGERVIVSPSENFGFINVTSFEPVAGGDRCAGGGQSFFYRFDIAGNFKRVAYRGQAVEVVGTEMPGSLAGYQQFGKPSTPTTGTASTGATAAQMSAIAQKALGATGGVSGATNPCGEAGKGETLGGGKGNSNVPSATMKLTCSVPAQRVWRDMPRGKR